MKTAALLALAFAGSLSADPIWSYQFTESSPNASFSIWHDGPLAPISDRLFLTGDQLHSCWPGTTLFYCAFVQLIVINDDLMVVFSRQPLDPRSDLITPDQIILTGAKLGVPGTYSQASQGAGILKISNDPADLAPEPLTWALLGFGLLGIGYAAAKQKKARLSPGLGASP